MKYKFIEQDERYFAGIEHSEELLFGENNVKVGETWKRIFHEFYDVIKMKTEPHQMIGLNCSSIDFEDTGKVNYFAMVETIALIEQDASLKRKKLPKGKYVCFDVSLEKMAEERRQVYEYCKDNNINIHEGFDYENYLNHVNYQEPNAMLEICLKLEDD